MSTMTEWAEQKRREQSERTTPNARASFLASDGLTPANAARIPELSNTLGVSENAVKQDIPYAENENKLRQIESVPSLSNWAASTPENTSFAKDDILGLTNVFNGVSDINLDFEKREQENLALLHQARTGDKQSADEVMRRQGYSEEAIKFGTIEAAPFSTVSHVSDLFYEGAVNVAENLSGVGNLASEVFGSSEMAESSRAHFDELRQSMPHIQPSDTFIGGLGQDIVRQIPQFATQILATMATGGVGGLATIASQVTGATYNELRERDVEPNRAAVSGVAAGILEGTLEQIGLNRVLGAWGKAGTDGIIKGIARAVGGETSTEYIQEFINEAVLTYGEAENKGQGFVNAAESYIARLPEINQQAAYEALIGGIFGLAGGGAGAVYQARENSRAQTFIDQQLELHDLVEASGTKALSPYYMASALEGAGLKGNAYLPASALFELMQGGNDILTPLGLDPVIVQEAAILGQDIPYRLSVAHSKLDTPQFQSFASIMKRDIEGYNSIDIAEYETRLTEDAVRIDSDMVDFQESQNRLDAATEVFREDLTEALSLSPALRKQVEYFGTRSGQGLNQYIDTIVTEQRRRAEILASRTVGTDGRPAITPESILERIQFGNEQRMTEEALYAEGVSYENDSYFFDHVWGRIDKEALRQVSPERTKELEFKYGNGIFAKKGDAQGFAIDEIADELTTLNMLNTETMQPADALIERLVYDDSLWTRENRTRLRRQKRLARSGRAQQSLFQSPEQETASIQAVREQYQGTDGFMKAPNGQDTNLSEHEWLTVRTDEFRSWFGSWDTDPANASKVVDENGEPLVVYHGSEVTDIESFMVGRSGVFGGGIYTTPSRDLAELYADESDGVYPLFERIENPLVIEGGSGSDVLLDALYPKKKEYKKRMSLRDTENDKGIITEADTNEIIKQGYDGIIWSDDSLGTQVVAFTPSQIKSTSNLGAFDPADDRILYQFMGEQGAANLDKAEESTIRLDNLNVARDMETAGKDEKTVKMATGWERGADGKWRYEVDSGVVDFTERLNKKLAKRMEEVASGKKHKKSIFQSVHDFFLGEEPEGIFKDIQITDILSDEILKAYPQLLDFNILKLDRSKDKIRGYLDYNRKVIASKFYEFRGEITFIDTTISILEHEIQHAIQYIEGFASGADASKFDVNDVVDIFSTELSSMDAYRNTAGEVEARNTASRLAMTPEQRRESLARDTEDVAREDQIFLEEGAEIAMSMTERSFEERRKNAKGSIQGLDDGSYLINVFEKADMSTITHELSHFWFLETDRLVQEGLADAGMAADLQVLRKWLGADESGTLTEAQQEKVAEAMECYLLEGVSPATNLDSIFAKFAVWLKSVYRRASRLGVNMTDEVRGVFDRMIATDFEIETKAAQNNVRRFTPQEMEGIGIIESSREFFNSLTGKAKDEAAAKLEQARMNARHELEKKLKGQIDAEVEKMPVYKARNMIYDKKLNKQAVASTMGQDFADTLSRKLVGMLRKESGATPEAIAIEVGYDSPEAMLEAVYASEGKTAFKKQLLEARMATSDVQFKAEDFLFETVNLALQETQIAIALNKKLGIEGSKPLTQAAIELYAREKIAWMQVKDATNTYKFLATARSVYKKERDALIRGQYEKALELNTQARINIAMAQWSRKLKESKEKTVRAIKRFVPMAKGDTSARYFANRLAAKFGLMRVDTQLSNNKDIKTIQTWAASPEVGMDVDMELLLEVPAERWSNMPIGTFIRLQRELDTIMHLERQERKIKTADGKKDADEVADSVVSSVYANNRIKEKETFGRENKFGNFWKNFHFSMVNASTIIELLDGDKQGVLFDLTIAKISDATWDETARTKLAKEGMANLFETAYTRKEINKIISDKVYVPELFGSMTTEKKKKVTGETLIMMGLNMGNAGNIDRLKAGYEIDGNPMTDVQIEAVKNMLTKKDWDFIQSVWDYYDTFQQESFDLTERMTGIRPVLVEATPVATEHGEYAGGYFPVKYDKDKSAAAPKSYAPEEGGSAFAVPVVPSGSMKERTIKGLGAPLQLDFSVIPSTITKTIHMLAFTEPVKEVSKVLRNKKVEKAISETAGVMAVTELRSWLIAVAGEIPLELGGMSGIFRYMRTSQSLLSMGFSIPTIVQQAFGGIVTADEIGTLYVAKGLMTTARKFLDKDFLAEIETRSPMMANRIKNSNREIADFDKQILSANPNMIMEKLKETAFLPSAYVQFYTSDLPSWVGAYEKGLKDFGGNEKKAATYADRVVEKTQGSGATKDRARIARGSQAEQNFTMYYTFFSAMYQIFTRRTSRIYQKRDMASSMAMARTLLITWVLQNTITNLAAGRGPDEDEGWAEWFIKLNAMYPFQAVPYVRDIANLLISDFGYTFSPAQSPPEAIGKGIAALWDAGSDYWTGEDEVDVKKTTLTVLKGVGLGFQQPLLGSQGIGALRTFWDWMDGTDPEFELMKMLRLKR